MTTDVQLNIWLPNVPGELAKLTDRLRASDVNIKAIFCTEGPNESILHLVVDDVETAKIVLKPIAKTTTNDVLVFRLKNQPGAAAQVARLCAGANINIRQIYSTTYGKEAMMYIVVDDVEKAKKVLG